MLNELAVLAAKGTLSLVFGAQDETDNRAAVLREILERMTRIGSKGTTGKRRSSWN
jgi:3-hydroxyisobutyrate dehydrogenase-like beta-hydroxyacid dehydrogenase